MPGLYQPGDYDLAGFVVGIGERDALIDGSDIAVGNRIIGLASSGIHSNGYSLVRKVFFEEQGHSVDDHIESLGCTVGEELLRPTRIYVESLLNVLRRQRINGLVHITGGGFIDNIPRILPAGCDAHIQAGSWPVPPVFAYLQEKGSISAAEMYRTFNMGIGMMAIVAENSVEDMLHQFKAHGEEPFLIGEIRAARGGAGRQVVLEGID
jgi:phosphoribosylformylglycinamidine cyclo-ligase